MYFFLSINFELFNSVLRSKVIVMIKYKLELDICFYYVEKMIIVSKTFLFKIYFLKHFKRLNWKIVCLNVKN